MLISAYTIFYEEEKFIFDLLQDLPAKKLKAKDIRVLLLNRDSPTWAERAELLIEKRLKTNDSVDFDSYLSRCKESVKRLEAECKAKVEFYDGRPTWRMYIFDQRLFVSRYYGPPSRFVEGHLSSVSAFDASHPMYAWLYTEFEQLCPTKWQNEIPRSTSSVA